MARRGVSGLVVITKSRRQIEMSIQPYLKGTSKGIWTGNKEITPRTETGAQLLEGEISMHDYILDLSEKEKVEMREALGFYSNGNLVRFDELYPGKAGKSGYIVCFEKDGNELRLLTIGSRTPAEFNKAGSDYEGRSTVPIVVTGQKVYDQNAIVSINI